MARRIVTQSEGHTGMPSTADAFDLDRFVQAQEPVMAQVQEELRAGRKRTHWMWFVFPQIAGLGHSAMARQYAIASRDEGVAYLAHHLLGERLVACTGLVNRLAGRSANHVFGSPDDLKFHSSMTLFARIQPAEPAFQAALDHFFDGRPDPATIQRIG